MDDENVLHGADYVEARGTLQPSTEYFSRAVRAAEKKHELTGELLVLVGPYIEANYGQQNTLFAAS